MSRYSKYILDFIINTEIFQKFTLVIILFYGKTTEKFYFCKKLNKI